MGALSSARDSPEGTRRQRQTSSRVEAGRSITQIGTSQTFRFHAWCAQQHRARAGSGTNPKKEGPHRCLRFPAQWDETSESKCGLWRVLVYWWSLFWHAETCPRCFTHKRRLVCASGMAATSMTRLMSCIQACFTCSDSGFTSSRKTC